MELFRYSINDVDFIVVGQPIIDNVTRKPFSFEILSRSVSFGKKFNIENYFKGLSEHDITWIASIQLTMLKGIIAGRATLPINLNVSHYSLFDEAFISQVSNMSNTKLIFEINGFEYNEQLLTDLRGAFRIVKSLGHEIWLDDYSVNNATELLLSALPWDGVKIDKGLFWQSSPARLSAKVKFCESIVNSVIIEGVEDDFLFDLSIKSSANYSQGFRWKLLNLENIFLAR
ncbi:EAL domain-containing protein [Plesiomonas shigelloides]|uniref:EAL domain-containing protein n=1 Tax=Plesiomonas shigelloides TaxID=703 RepID=UPI00057AB3EC|nr:EAL domain-containing protein [Plesiomonas shigelloides]